MSSPCSSNRWKPRPSKKTHTQLQLKPRKSHLPFKKIHMLLPLLSKRRLETRMKQIWDSITSNSSSSQHLRRTFSMTTKKRRSISRKKSNPSRTPTHNRKFLWVSGLSAPTSWERPLFRCLTTSLQPAIASTIKQSKLTQLKAMGTLICEPIMRRRSLSKKSWHSTVNHSKLKALLRTTKMRLNNRL